MGLGVATEESSANGIAYRRIAVDASYLQNYLGGMSASIELDATDARILALLQENARTSNADIARAVAMAPSAVLERIRRLEARGIIQGYEAKLDYQALGFGLTAFILVRTEERVGSGSIGQALARIPEVQEVHHVAGEDCYLVKVRVPDTDRLGTLLRERFGRLKSVRNTRTTIVLSTVKDSQRLPVAAAERKGAEK